VDGSADPAATSSTWRLSLAAPTEAELPLDEESLEEGPLHHRFAVASHGYVTSEAAQLDVERASTPVDPDGNLDVVVAARRERQAEVDAAATDVVSHLAPTLDEASANRAAALVHSLVEGVGIGVCLGRISPEQAVEQLREHLRVLQVLARVEACPTTSRP
jgi:citrate lyase gamma subunit